MCGKRESRSKANKIDCSLWPWGKVSKLTDTFYKMSSLFTNGFTEPIYATYSTFNQKNGLAVTFTYRKTVDGQEHIEFFPAKDFKVNPKTIHLIHLRQKDILKKSNYHVTNCELGFQILFTENMEDAWNHMKRGTFPQGYRGDDDRLYNQTLHFRGHLLLSVEQFRQLRSSPSYSMSPIRIG